MTDRPSDRAIAQAFWEWEIYQPEAVAKVMDNIKDRAREIDAAAPDGAMAVARVPMDSRMSVVDWLAPMPAPGTLLYAAPPSQDAEDAAISDSAIEAACAAMWSTWKRPALRTDEDRERMRAVLIAARAARGGG